MQAQDVPQPVLSPEMARLEEWLTADVPPVLKSRAEHAREEKLELQEIQRLSRLDLLSSWREKWNKFRAALNARDKEVASLSEAHPSTNRGDIRDSPESQRAQQPTSNPSVSRTTPADARAPKDKLSTSLPLKHEDQSRETPSETKKQEMARPAAPVSTSSTPAKSGIQASRWADAPDPPTDNKTAVLHVNKTRSNAMEALPPPPKPSGSEQSEVDASHDSSESEHSAPVAEPYARDGEAEHADQSSSSEQVPQKKSGMHSSRWVGAPTSLVEVKVINDGVSASRTDASASERTLTRSAALGRDGPSVQPLSMTDRLEKSQPQWDKLPLPCEPGPHWTTAQPLRGESSRDTHPAKASDEHSWLAERSRLLRQQQDLRTHFSEVSGDDCSQIERLETQLAESQHQAEAKQEQYGRLESQLQQTKNELRQEQERHRDALALTKTEVLGN